MTQFSWRDLILIAGGLFLVWKATKEIHHSRRPSRDSHDVLDTQKAAVTLSFGGRHRRRSSSSIIVFSIDSILTAVGMTDASAGDGGGGDRRGGR